MCNTIEKTFNFGKIDYYGRGRNINSVDVEVELRDRDGYLELSICASIWNGNHTDIICGGQCLDEIKEFRDSLKNPELFDELYALWKEWHLNGMNAGTPEQTKAVNEWCANHQYDYTEIVEHLKELGLYEVPYTGKAIGKEYNNELYRYGSAWLIRELPDEVVKRVTEILSD